VDLNADVGEGFDTDDALIAIVTSANVACGFHAGSAETMHAACRAAVARGVAIGAHVSYRDSEGFGRRELDVAPHVVREEVAEQLALLAEAARAEGGRVAYVKPHGALYHRATVDDDCARAIVEASGGLAQLGWPGSRLLAHAHVGVAEGFADRAYTRDGALVSRREPGAVLHDPALVAERVARLAREGRIATADGGELALDARTVCIHGDTPGAADLASAVRARLDKDGIAVRPFSIPTP
jgi:UPF0271 protein